MTRIIGIIPARYHSTRFPAKALADIGGKSMIQRVYEQARQATKLDRVVVATDHQDILDAVERFGGDVVMTDAKHPSGTDRCHEALSKQSDPFDYVINVQGDEPFISPKQIDLLASLLEGTVQLATLAKKIDDPLEISDPNVVKVVFAKNGNALLFSRASIPYVRNTEKSNWINHQDFHKHIGIYAYRADILHQITRLLPSSLEKSESLEQLRWLENGYQIKVAETDFPSIGIDTPEDLKKITHLY
ncbi:3-deoxy-manno-octulosonate cytidylyltransferase [Fulvivirga sp. M361]|uniref:3-deoxy-manno-octulosonate cytidylyltransferase n=1 Tax=Fulvivirga sp. M361 TaxID=2594266 RepID=UPI00117A9630|nr:3-deoxy-manno-octulosonate cytidylyltransferase [Fulvivirga sp. M361]TRX54357.1 3-deoxy-manno-octulosonate cytidylyltransferase [Fulvivirga sp. M361]